MTTTRTIDLEPRWVDLVRPMLAVVADHEDTPEGHAAAINIVGEFGRMAEAADNWNDHVRVAGLAIETADDSELLDDLLIRLHATADESPGWLVEASGLDALMDRLERVHEAARQRGVHPA